ncbi:MAG: methionyl-tRNA formyltransferase [Armatimonadota bacterium]|nr:methionyl-tRNA formyltransferase [Armatimonadota bacterium]
MTEGHTGLRAIFLGTPAFAVPSLRALARTTTIAAVITQPDRPAGRGRRLTSPPVAAAARALGLSVMQPKTLRDSAVQAELASLRPDLLVVAAYGRVIPRAVLDLPRLGTVNVHPSLLPRYRGASPIQAAIRDGATATGVTIMYLSDELDAGDIIVQREVPIGPEETAGELEGRLAEIGATLLVEAVARIARGDAPRQPQDHRRATYVGKVSKADGEIAWDRPAREIVNLVRAMNPWPCAFTTWPGGTLRVWKARAAEGAGTPGEVLATGDAGIVVAAGQGAVVLLEVQAEGGRRMPAQEFLRGHALRPGTRLGVPAASCRPE